MRKTINEMQSDELIAHISEELEVYKEEKATGTPYLTITLSDLQKYSKALELSVLLQNPSGIALQSELNQILESDGNVNWGKIERKPVKSLYEVHKEQEQLLQSRFRY